MSEDGAAGARDGASGGGGVAGAGPGGGNPPGPTHRPHVQGDLTIRIGREELVIRKRYEALSIGNDVLIGLWFLVGSFLFFSDTLSYAGTWLFVIGSVEMLVRPVIRLVRHLHLQKFRPDEETATTSTVDSPFDY